MIRIQKPAEPPDVLTTRGAAAARQLCRAFNHGRRQFTRDDFDSGIYSHDDVKTMLRYAQHDKCCFCESSFTHVQYGDVEHFRPKAAYRQSPADPLHQPGYYWLAYDWPNLFFCCQLCNQRHKRNLFPLGNPARRALRHTHNVTRERPLFINPAVENPTEFIEFEEEVARAVGKSRRGRATIDALALNRLELQKRRRTWLVMLKTLKNNRDLLANLIAKIDPADIASIEPMRKQLEEDDAILTAHQHDSAEYASMARAFFRRR
jgi:uncharacterized protein (TIGR02646 family)